MIHSATIWHQTSRTCLVVRCGLEANGSRTLTIKDLEAITVKKDGEGSFKEENSKAKVTRGPKLTFNPILGFFEVLRVNYQG